jgi:hypothetical protein
MFAMVAFLETVVVIFFYFFSLYSFSKTISTVLSMRADSAVFW